VSSVPVILDVSNLRVRYGPIEAVHGISFDIRQGEIVALIGPNGAGKTSTLLAISGVQRPAAGTVRFMGEEIQRLPGHRIAALGLGHVPEGRRIFSRMSVWENLAMGTYAQRRLPGADDLDSVYSLFPVLKDRQRQMAGTLSGGEQQMLALARCLVARPRLLLMDEPSMGLSPILVQSIFKLITMINRQEPRVTMLLVEQNARMALRIGHRAHVLESGNISVSGDCKDLLANDAVRAAYLGGSVSDGASTQPKPDDSVQS
jgi:branched-chain amino acid transport system ATP-binding protein